MPEAISSDPADAGNPDVQYIGDAAPEPPETPTSDLNGEGEATLATEDENASEAPTEELESDPPEETEETKRKSKLESRFSELTQRRNEAQRMAEAERQGRLKAEAELAQYRQQEVAQKPVYENFADPQDYAEALAKYERRQATIETEQRIRYEQEQEKIQERSSAWQQKLELAKKELPDFDLIVQSATAEVSDDLKEAILDSEIGPQLLYHLADDDALVARLSRLPTTSALRELGKIEARIEQDKAKPKLVKGTSAPEPIKPIRQTSTIQQSWQAKGDIQLDQLDTYRAMRQSGKIR